jgi:hypothetical protein
MSEPTTRADRIVRVIPTVFRWSVRDDRNEGARADAHAVVSAGRTVLIDPLPVEESALRRLGEIEAVVLTAGNHQRAAWSLRRSLGCRVWAPESAHGLEEAPDQTYTGGDALPCGLSAYDAPGPAHVMYALWLAGPRTVVFFSDQLVHDGSGTPRFFPSEYQDAPERTRASVRRIAEHLPADVLCFGHGAPIMTDGTAALRRALDADQGSQPAAY